MIRQRLKPRLIYLILIIMLIDCEAISQQLFTNKMILTPINPRRSLIKPSSSIDAIHKTTRYFYWPSAFDHRFSKKPVQLVNYDWLNSKPLQLYQTSSDPSIADRRQYETFGTPVLISTNLATQPGATVNPFVNSFSNSDGDLSDRWDRNVWFWPLILATALPIVIGAIVLPLAVFFLIELIFIMLMMRNQAVTVTPLPAQNGNRHRARRQKRDNLSQKLIRLNPNIYSNQYYLATYNDNQLIDLVEQRFLYSFANYKHNDFA